MLIHRFSSPEALSEIFIDFLHSNDKTSLIVLTGSKFDDAVTSFRSLFHEIKAAGGVVRNYRGLYLFIKRHNMWDLPKGKLEAGENPADGALREVSEETGLHGLTINSSPVSTFHIYTDHKGGFILKETFWYGMSYTGNEYPVPQIEEDITEVRWFNPDEVGQALENTYLSLKEMFTRFFASANRESGNL